MEKLRTDLATAKQEAAIMALEFSEKMKRLHEERPSPRGQCQHAALAQSSGPDSGLSFDQGHTRSLRCLWAQLGHHASGQRKCVVS